MCLYPYACGETQILSIQMLRHQPVPVRMWGNISQTFSYGLFSTCTRTHVGKHEITEVSDELLDLYPYACGETFLTDPISYPQSPVPVRMWGNTCYRISAIPSSTCTRTHVGKQLSVNTSLDSIGLYPYACGETTGIFPYLKGIDRYFCSKFFNFGNPVRNSILQDRLSASSTTLSANNIVNVRCSTSRMKSGRMQTSLAGRRSHAPTGRP